MANLSTFFGGLYLVRKRDGISVKYWVEEHRHLNNDLIYKVCKIHSLKTVPWILVIQFRFWNKQNDEIFAYFGT